MSCTEERDLRFLRVQPVSQIVVFRTTHQLVLRIVAVCPLARLSTSGRLHQPPICFTNTGGLPHRSPDSQISAACPPSRLFREYRRSSQPVCLFCEECNRGLQPNRYGQKPKKRTPDLFLNKCICFEIVMFISKIILI